MPAPVCGFNIVGWGSAILAGVIGIGFAQQHQTIELRKRIGSEEKRIDCAEDGRVCADAEGKGQNCSQRETWGADQPPQAVTQVLEKHSQDHLHVYQLAIPKGLNRSQL